MTLDKTHKELGEAYSRYLMEFEAFHVGKKKVAASRARKALAEFVKLAKEQRKDISEAKHKMGGAGTKKSRKRSSKSS
jgi:hypothetical protein